MPKVFSVDIPVWATVYIEAQDQADAVRKAYAAAKCTECAISSTEITDVKELSPVATVACNPEQWIGLTATFFEGEFE